MAKSKLTACKACGAEIAKSAKSCPHCGAKNKKPIFKRWWFWVVVIILLNSIGNSGKKSNQKNVVSNNTGVNQSISQVEVHETATAAKETTVVTTEATASAEVEQTETMEATDATEAPSGINPEFKAAMDAYESFYTEYWELMKQYMDNPTDMGLLVKYGQMLVKMEEVNKAFEAWDESDLNAEELKYYLDVNNRVLKMLVDLE